MYKLIIVFLVVGLLAGSVEAITLRDDLHSNVSRGNRYYRAGKHQKALQRYQEAQGLDSTSAVPHFNAGDALFRLGNYRDGALEFLKSVSSETDSLKAMSYYNLGNTMFRGGDLRSAVEAYKRSLLIDPEDEDAKFNLEFALKMIDEQEEQQQNQQQQDQEEQQQDQEDQQDRSRPQQEQKPPEISPEELERILAAIEASDKKTQEEMMQKASRRKTSTGKDW